RRHQRAARLTAIATGVQRALDGAQQLGERQRLLDEIEGTEPRRFDGGLDRTMTRHHHDGAGRAVRLRPLAQQRDAVCVGHPDVQQHEVGVVLRADRARLGSVRGNVYFIAFVREDLLQEPADFGFIVDDKYARSAHARSLLVPVRRSRVGPVRTPTVSGNSIRTRAPPVRALSASIRPPCSSTIFFTIASPRPVPFDFVVTYGSNTCPMTSGRKPGPLSSTVISAKRPSARSTSRVSTRISGSGAPSNASMALASRL